MSQVHRFPIANIQVGTGDRTFVIIELGVTHGNDEKLAETMIRTAKEAGADAVKCEVIKPDQLVARDYRDKLEYSYVAYSGTNVVRKYYDLVKELEMPRDMIVRLKGYADKIGIPFFGTAFDLESVDFLKSIKSCAVKMSSPEITHLPLLDHAARSGMPVLLDSGRATVDEIVAAVNHVRKCGCDSVAVMHNPSGYPAPFEDVHLRMIPTLREKTGVAVGLSCHNRGMAICFGAVGIGADLIEKPVTDDNTRDGDEHIFSLNVEEVPEFVRTIRQVDTAKGLANRDPRILRDSEHARNTYRQSLVAARDLPDGHKLARSDVTFSRPGWGILASDVDKAIGATLRRPIESGNVIHWADVSDR